VQTTTTHRQSDWSLNAAAGSRRPVSGPWATPLCGVRIWGTARTSATVVGPFVTGFLENDQNGGVIIFPVPIGYNILEPNKLNYLFGFTELCHSNRIINYQILCITITPTATKQLYIIFKIQANLLACCI